MHLFEGVIGRAYQQLYEPIISYKDELEMLLNLKIPNKKKNLETELQELKKEVEQKR